MASLFRRKMFWKAFSTDKSLNRALMILVLKAIVVAYNVCNCSPIHSKSSTIIPQRSAALQLIDDDSSLPQNILVNKFDNDNSNSNNKLYNHDFNHFYRQSQPNSLQSNATIISFLSKLSIIKHRLTRQTPTLNVDARVSCETDYDCQESSSRNALLTNARNAHNQTLESLQFVCISGACGQQGNMNNTSPNNGTDFQPNNPFTPSDASSERLRMLPIMIVLGVMFVGICVAMNLFSRARFKNHRSGIFANPRILKVATAQNAQNGAKRRRSKVSSRRSRTELLARAQQMSEQLQKQHQLQMEQQTTQEEEEEEIDELELSIDKLSATPTGTNQLTTYVQVESSLPSDDHSPPDNNNDTRPANSN